MFENLINPIEARPENFGPMHDASAHAKITGPCGDTVEVWLRIDGGKIRKGSFISDGCAQSLHCCSIAVKMTEGLDLEEAAELQPARVLEAADPVPEDHRHCALLAINVIRKALADYQTLPGKIPLKQHLKKLFNDTANNNPEKKHV